MSRTVGAAVALLAAAPPALAFTREIPALSGPVVDEAGLLGGGDRERLGALCRRAWAMPPERRVQLQYLLVPSLDGEDLEAYAVRAFAAWRLGDKGRDNGVLVVVARDDRKMRIEVGYGAEGALTDAQAGRIIRDTMAPAFRQGRYGDGLYRAGTQILATLGALPPDIVGQSVGEQMWEAMPGWVRVMTALLVLSILAGILFMSYVFYYMTRDVIRGVRGILRGIRRVGRGEPWAEPEPLSEYRVLGPGSGHTLSSSGTGWSSSWSGSGSWSGGGGSSGGGGASGSW
jgi:uncharacterized protein